VQIQPLLLLLSHNKRQVKTQPIMSVTSFSLQKMSAWKKKNTTVTMANNYRVGAFHRKHAYLNIWTRCVALSSKRRALLINFTTCSINS